LAASILLSGCAGEAPVDSPQDGSVDNPQDGSADRQSPGHDIGSQHDSGAQKDVTLAPDTTASSGGSGGAYPGNQTRTAIAKGASFSYHLYIPKAYDPAKAWPLLSVFHGQGDTGANIRDYWAPVAESNGFIVVATTSTGTSGGWSGSTDVPRYDAALNDALESYNVATSRLYVWGFSAGAHLVHAIALLNADLFAAYAVNAGVLAALAGTNAPAAAPRKIPVSIRIGDADPMLGQARQDRDRFKAAGWVEGQNLAYSEFSGGHQLPSGDRQLAWDFIGKHTWP
jgi:poly(3-hydroxybutyrate) depolymerase